VWIADYVIPLPPTENAEKDTSTQIIGALVERSALR
jgi:hypothetical protein